MKFKTQWNAKDLAVNEETGELERVFPDSYEVNNEPSNTVPDMTMSIAEIMERHTRGIPINKKIEVYNGDEEVVPDLSKMDLADRQEFIERTKEEIEATKKKFVAEREAKKKKADQGEKVQRTSGSGRSSKEEDEPEHQHPKKTRGAGAAPRDRERHSEKGGDEYAEAE